VVIEHAIVFVRKNLFTLYSKLDAKRIEQGEFFYFNKIVNIIFNYYSFIYLWLKKAGRIGKLIGLSQKIEIDKIICWTTR